MNKEGKFFNFNIGHVILLVSWIAGASWFSSSLTTNVQALDKRLSLLENESKETVQLMDNIKTSIVNLNAHQNSIDNKFIGSDNRLAILESNMSKISAMATDISWLKENLTKQQDRLGEALLKVLNDKNNGTRP